jgi:hypothetical protein
MMYFLFLPTALMKITALKCGDLSFLSDNNTLMHHISHYKTIVILDYRLEVSSQNLNLINYFYFDDLRKTISFFSLFPLTF